jgi:hypothetical protein
MARASVPPIVIDGVRIVPDAVWPRRPLEDRDFSFETRCVSAYPHEFVGVVYLAGDDTPLGVTPSTREFAQVGRLANEAVRQVAG